MRIHELGKELNVASKEIIKFLKDRDVAVKTHMSKVEDPHIDAVRSHFSANGSSPEAAPAAETVEPPTAPVEPVSAEKAPEPEPEPKESPKKTDSDEEAELEAAIAAEEVSASDLEADAEKPAERPSAKMVRFVGQIIVKDLAAELGLRPNKLVAELMKMNVLASINEKLDVQTAKKIAKSHGYELEYEKKTADHKPAVKKGAVEESIASDTEKDLAPRPPVVTILGHVDHGKTTLLDNIRNSNVVDDESGGITQHIGAYQVEINGQHITFLDTPGHAAFTAMRARGANLTDIAIIVIAADDGIMPQTEEAIRHAQAADVSIMIALNKMDAPGANPDKVKMALQSIDLTPEDWGGETICVPISALKGDGIDTLLEMIALQAEVLELKANAKRKANGYIVEARLEPGMGPIAHILVTGGTLKVGDTILCGNHYGRVKALINDRGEKIKKAGPSTPVKCMGLSGVPEAGAEFQVYKNERSARQIAEKRATEEKHADLQTTGITSLDDLYAQVEKADQVELTLIIKTDTRGSVEAIIHSLEEIKSDKIHLNIVQSNCGNITVNDVLLAKASSAIIMGFHVGIENGVNPAAKREGVEIRLHSVIYEMIEEVRNAMTGLLEPTLEETITGHAEIRQVFPISKVGKVAGCLCTDGTITFGSRARLLRNNEVVYIGMVKTLKRFKNDSKEVNEGQECGINLDNFKDYEEGDIIEAYTVAQVDQTL